MKHFTIDLEEWWSGESFKNYFKVKSIPRDDRIHLGLDSFLKLLKDYNQKATFFVLGRVAEKHPDLVPMLVEQGHFIGTHGHSHELIYKQSPAEFESDLVSSIEVLSRQTGSKIKFYRAPSYSVTSNCLWALDILTKNGITVDSSISPATNSRFGIAGAPEYSYCIQTKHGLLKEIPPNILNLGKKLPITSGFGFRFFPQWLVHRSVRKFDSKGVNSMFIFHNWEMDVDQPLLKAGKVPELIHYHGIHRMKKNVEVLLKRYNFNPLSTSLEGLEKYCINKGNLEKKF